MATYWSWINLYCKSEDNFWRGKFRGAHSVQGNGGLGLVLRRSFMAPCERQNRGRVGSLEKRDEVCAVRPWVQQIKSKGFLKRHWIPLLIPCLYCHYFVFQLSGVLGRTHLLGVPCHWWLVSQGGGNMHRCCWGVHFKGVSMHVLFPALLKPVTRTWPRQRGQLTASHICSGSMILVCFVGPSRNFLRFCNSTSICSYWRVSGVSDVPDLSCSLPGGRSQFIIIDFEFVVEGDALWPAACSGRWVDVLGSLYTWHSLPGTLWSWQSP